MPDAVILLHGLGRSARSMGKMARGLKKAGFMPHPVDYPSRKTTIEMLASGHVAPAVRRCRRSGAGPIHMVTHSLGGILARQFLQTHQLPPQSRLVMLSPPNSGSEIVDRFKKNPLFKWVVGPAGRQLSTDHQSLPNRLHPVSAQVGIITGNRSREPWFNWLFSGPNDGKVSVSRTRLKEMRALLEIPSGHTFIMNNDVVIEQVVFFLQHGRFDMGMG